MLTNRSRDVKRSHPSGRASEGVSTWVENVVQKSLSILLSAHLARSFSEYLHRANR
jgi:hypothetical protein